MNRRGSSVAFVVVVVVVAAGLTASCSSPAPHGPSNESPDSRRDGLRAPPELVSFDRGTEPFDAGDDSIEWHTPVDAGTMEVRDCGMSPVTPYDAGVRVREGGSDAQ